MYRYWSAGHHHPLEKETRLEYLHKDAIRMLDHRGGTWNHACLVACQVVPTSSGAGWRCGCGSMWVDTVAEIVMVAAVDNLLDMVCYS